MSEDNDKPGPGTHTPAFSTAMSWVVRKDRGLTASESQELAAWLAGNQVNRDNFAGAVNCWHRLDQLPRVDSLAEETDAIVARAKARRLRARNRLYAGVVGLAAALAIAFILSNSHPSSSVEAAAIAVAPSQAYQVLESTARRITLSDGSMVELNGTSRLSVDFTAEERRVTLIAGEAQFFVSKDPQRPFLVTAQGVTVRAVGTAFNVRMASSSIEVLVTEGKVLLHRPDPANRTLSSREPGPSVVAGELAVVSTSQSDAPISIGKAGTSDVDQALAWQTTRLVFDRTPLKDVIAAFNRYNQHQLVLGSPELRSRMLSGVFRADNLDGFLRLLQISVDVRAEQLSEVETVIVPAR